MLKALGLVLTIALLLAITSCQPGGTNSNNATPSPSASTPTPASPSPTVTASVSPSPATGSVKGSNFKWTDDASGTPVTTIKVGGSVTWTITGGTHKLERVAGSAANGCDNLDASFDSGNLTSGQTATRTFTKVGTFGYHCGIHLGDPNCKTTPGTGAMPGVIKVVP
ncbi:MAG TPA: hypothetical protein VN644_15005 [Pyrinomonadaceae bacterium]|jgi:plastocyanin|nr:hypothetical protein [Pyrinomonadaceae bacterium]